MSDYEVYTTPEASSLGDAEHRARRGKALEQKGGPGRKHVEEKKHDAHTLGEGITGNTSLKSDGTSGG